MATTKRDPMNIGCSHPGACQLADSVAHVKCGTPLRSSKDGYVIAQPNEEPEFYATAHAEAGMVVRAWKSLTIDTYEKDYRPGDRLDIQQIDDYGNLYFVQDAEGPYAATGESTIHLDTTQWLVRKGIRLARERSKLDGKPVQELREHEAQHSQVSDAQVTPTPKPQRTIDGW